MDQSVPYSASAAPRPWVATYPSGVPAEIDPNVYDSAADFISKTAAKYGARTAFQQLGVDLTYHQLDDDSAQLAAYFQIDLKLQPGDRIALMLPNVLQYPVAMFAALRAGLTVVNVNPLYTAPELVGLIESSTPRAILVLETFAATLEKTFQSAKVEHVIIARIVDFMKFPKSLIADYIIRKKRKLVPAWHIEGVHQFRDAMKAHPPASFRQPKLDHESVAFLQYTGGTTGKPKGAVLTHGNIIAAVLGFGAWWEPKFGVEQERMLIALPLYHVAALVAQMLTSLHLGSASRLVINARDIPAVVKDFAEFKPTFFLGLNTLLAALMNNVEFQKLDFSSLKFTGAGGTATKSAVADRWQAMTGKVVLEGYGLSETCGAATVTSYENKTFDGTIGVPLPSLDIEIRNLIGEKVPYGTAGELCIKGPVVMRGYYNLPHETAKVIGEDGFFATGDIAVMEPSGKIKIVDRMKDMILVSGFNVYPNEIEDVLFKLDGVIDVAVIGIADEQSGEVPAAYIVRRDNDLTEEKVIQFSRENLAAYKTPKHIIFKSELPKSPVGKTLRRELRAP